MEFRVSEEQRKQLALANLRYIEGFAWVTYAPCRNPGCQCTEQYLGSTPEEAVYNAMTERK